MRARWRPGRRRCAGRRPACQSASAAGRRAAAAMPAQRPQSAAALCLVAPATPRSRPSNYQVREQIFSRVQLTICASVQLSRILHLRRRALVMGSQTVKFRFSLKICASVLQPRVLPHPHLHNCALVIPGRRVKFHTGRPELHSVQSAAAPHPHLRCRILCVTDVGDSVVRRQSAMMGSKNKLCQSQMCSCDRVQLHQSVRR